MIEEVVSEPPKEEPATAEVVSAETPAAEVVEDKPEKKDGFQKAIDRQTRKYYQEKARADSLERELRQKNPANTVQNPNAEPDRNTFTDSEEYTKAVIRFEANKIADAKLAQVKHTEQAKEIKTRWDKDAALVKKDSADFDDVVPDFFESSHFTPVIDRAVMESDRPAAVIHYLATHEEEAESISAMSDYKAAIAIGRIESKIATAPAAKKASSAPAPIKPLGAKGGNGGEVDPEKESPKEYAARRNKELASRGKR